jgi:hypothetical protein
MRGPDYGHERVEGERRAAHPDAAARRARAAPDSCGVVARSWGRTCQVRLASWKLAWTASFLGRSARAARPAEVRCADVVSVADGDGVEHGGSMDINTHPTHQSGIRRGHLSLAAPVPAQIPLTAQEVRAMSRVAALLRRRAARLPEDSPLRAELIEIAEYYATGISGPVASGGGGLIDHA